MPFISNLTKPAIRNALRKFGLRELHSFREFPFGIENANIKVETEKGTFVLREWSTAKPDNIAFELSLMKHLSKKGFPVPRTFRALNGKETIVFKGKRFTLFEFMPGKHVKKPNARQLHAMGEMLAEMQLALKDCKPEGKSSLKDLFDFRFEQKTLKEPLSRYGEKYASVARQAKQELETLKTGLRKTKRIRSGPTHHDFFYWNAKLEGNKISAILDFGDACIGTWTSDLATTLVDSTQTKEGITLAKIRPIMKGYQTKITLNAEEKKILPNLMLHRALRMITFDLHAMQEQPKNKPVHAKWLKQDRETAKQIKKQLQKIREATRS